jgi:hypothetical protein
MQSLGHEMLLFTTVEDNWSIHDDANANGREPICIIYANFSRSACRLISSMDFACNCYPHSNRPLVSMISAHVFYANLCKFYAKIDQIVLSVRAGVA